MVPRALPPLWLATPSRYAGLSPIKSRLTLALFAMLLLFCLTAIGSPGPRPSGSSVTSTAPDGQTDLSLYQDIVAGVRDGGAYYDVAAQSQRLGHYPLRPFVAMRLPTLAVVQASLPSMIVRLLIVLSCAGTVLAWTLRLRPAMARSLAVAVGAVLAYAGLVVNLDPTQIVFHEIWAGPLIALSLALRRPGDWLPAVAVGLCAMLIRETALLYVMVMAGAAWWDGERREALGWLTAIAIFAVVLAAHAHAVTLVAEPQDRTSQGWNGLQGFGFFVRLATISCALDLMPQWLAALLVGVSLLGWSAWRDATAARGLATIIGYAATISLFARSDNFYWALITTPILLIGLVFAPDALRDLVTRALDTRRIVVRRIGP